MNELDDIIKECIFETITEGFGVEYINDNFELNDEDNYYVKRMKKSNQRELKRIEIMKEQMYGEKSKEIFEFEFDFLQENDNQQIGISKSQIDEKIEERMKERIKTAIKENHIEVNHIIVIREEIKYNIIKSCVDEAFEELHIDVNTIHFMTPYDVGQGACQRAIEIHQFGKNKQIFRDENRIDIEFCPEHPQILSEEKDN